MILYRTELLGLRPCESHDKGLTVFHGARVLLNPGHSIITSRLYCFSAGIPKKPESSVFKAFGIDEEPTHPQRNFEQI